MEMAVKKKIIPIIIFDDAHFLKNENFFELQILSNFNFDSLSPALFVLIAQPHLQDRLKRPVFDSFYQRISMQINLQPLSCQETRDFIVQVLKNAAGVGGSGDGDGDGDGDSDGLSLQTSNASISRFENLFTPQACQLIFKCSGGIPRLIAKIMEKALIYGSAHQLDTLDENVIYQIEPEL
jgi:type II secretory pathway predicted ATPase ExeA